MWPYHDRRIQPEGRVGFRTGGENRGTGGTDGEKHRTERRNDRDGERGEKEVERSKERETSGGQRGSVLQLI